MGYIGDHIGGVCVIIGDYIGGVWVIIGDFMCYRLNS